MTCQCSRRSLLALAGATAMTPLITLAEGIQVLTGKASSLGAKKLRISVTENDTLIKVGHDAMLAQAGAELELTEGGGGIKELVLEAGRVLSVFRPDGQERTIKNHGVTAGVRCTAVYTHRMHGQTYFCVCYGAVDYQYQGLTDRVETNYHQARIFSEGTISRSNYGAPAMHYDDELAMLERSVGREPHWTLPDGKMKFKRPGPLPVIR